MANTLVADSATPSLSWRHVEAAQRQVDDISRKVLALPIAEIRKLGYHPPPLPKGVPEAGKDVEISTVDIAARDGVLIPLRLYKPKCTDEVLSLFFNIHGGGFVMGTPETEEAQNRFIAVKNKTLVVSVDYRRAPENPYPIPLNDCHDAFQKCRENAVNWGFDVNKIIIGGGSAGANLTAALLLQAELEGTHGIVGQILNIPVTCHPQHFPVSRYSNHSYAQNAKSPIVDSEKMSWFWSQYLGGADIELAKDPSVSPLLAGEDSLRALPATLIQVAGMDPLRDQGLAYAKALEASGVSVTVKLHPGVPHAFYIHPDLPESHEYFCTMVTWISGILKGEAV